MVKSCSCLCRYRISGTPQIGKGAIQQESTEGRRKAQSPFPNIITGGSSQPYSAFRPKERGFPFHRDVVQVTAVMAYLGILHTKKTMSYCLLMFSYFMCCLQVVSRSHALQRKC